MKKIDLQLNFDAIRERIELEKKCFKPGAWAEMVGVSVNVVSNVHGKTKQNPSLEYIIAVAKVTGKSVDYFLWGTESEKPQKNESNNVTIIKHQELVSEFDDQETGIKNNLRLIGIEKANKDLYQKVTEYIKINYEAVKIITGGKPEEKKTSGTGKKKAQGE